MTVVDGKVTINAAITNILAENYGTAFAAIAYVEIDGVYYYTAFDIYSNARSVDSVAAAALDDLKAEADEEYKYAVTAYGTTVYSPYNAYQRGVLEGFLKVTVGVPRADGATLVNTGSGAYMYFSADVNSEEYASYKASLAAVFEFVAENDLEGNLYTTYAKGEQIVTLAYTPNTKEMRVIMESTDNTSLIEDQDYTAPEAPVATTLTQIGQWYGNTATEEHKFYTESGIGNTIGSMKNFAIGNNNGMGYVIRLEDGSFIVVDGGDDSELHADNLYNVLKTQAGDGDIVIAAWILTHAHGDHTGAFVQFTEKYSGEVTVEKFIYNIPAKNASEFGGSERSDIDKVAQCTKKYGADIIIARAGQVFEIRNAVINILYTYDMMQPYYLVDYNACSVVFNVVVENKTILFLGDAGGETNSIDGELSKMLDIYTAATLKADIAQAAHHGLDEHEKVAAFYKVVNPAQLLIPVASEYIKVNNSHYWINERSAYETCTRAEKYIAGDEVIVLTLGDGKVTTYDNVDAYKNS